MNSNDVVTNINAEPEAIELLNKQFTNISNAYIDHLYIVQHRPLTYSHIKIQCVGFETPIVVVRLPP